MDMRSMMRTTTGFWRVLAFALLTQSCDSTQLTPVARANGSRKAPLALPPWLKHVLAGGTSRAIAQMTLYPVDALRTLAQTRDGRTLKDVGIASLVRGSATTSAFALGMGSIQFGIFGACRARGISALWASALGAAGSCVVSVPQEVIKQRLVTKIYPSFGVAIKSIAQTEGIRGFYAAWRPTMARNVPFVVTCFTTMDILKTNLLKKKLKKKSDSKSLSPAETVAAGVAAAFVAGIVTNPMDVIKTRLMTQASSQQIPYTSAINCFLTIVRTEGVGKLYAGFRQRSIYMCSLWGCTFALNTQIERMLFDQS